MKYINTAMHGYNNFFNKSSTVSFGDKTKLHVTSVYFIVPYIVFKSHLMF